MQIRVLGCSGSIAADSRTTSFLLDDDVLIDAGTGVGELQLEEMVKVDHILLSHSHLDHVLAIGLLADSVQRRRAAAGRPPVRVHALAATLHALQTHLFNNIIWPDFTQLPSREHPTLAFSPIEVGQVLELQGRRIEVLSAVHTVPAVGFAVHGSAGARHGAWVFSGDTGPNPALWQRLAQMKLAALVIETAFTNHDEALAALSQHLCPATLKRELAQLAAPADVYITHIKPGEVEAVMAEIGAQGSAHRIQVLQAGQVMRYGA